MPATMLGASKQHMRTTSCTLTSWKQKARSCGCGTPSAPTRLTARQQRQSVKVLASQSDGPPKPISVRMPWVKTGAAYTFILAGFLKILIFHIPGRSMVRTPLGEITPYLQVPFGLALCLLGKWAIDNDIAEKAPRLFYGMIAGVIIFMFMIANLSYDWRESDRVRERQYQGYQTSSIVVNSAQQSRADAERYAAKVREEETRQLLYMMEQDNLPVPDHLKPENPYPKLSPKTLQDLQGYDPYGETETAPQRRGGPRYPTQVGGE